VTNTKLGGRTSDVETKFAVEDHTRGRDPIVSSIYDALLKSARRLGSVKEEAKKTSIHLVRRTAFAGVATRKSFVVLTVKSANDVKSPRISKHEQVSTGRWHLEIRLTSPDDVDKQVAGWLKDAYQLSG
jgi:hypothetical protein